MLFHNLKFALRNLRRHASYNFLNIGGLAIGLASFLMIALFIQTEFSYDTWLKNSDRVYRIPMEITGEGNVRKFSNIGGPVGPAIQKDFPQVETMLRLWPRSMRLVKLPGGDLYYEDDVYNAEAEFFEFFPLGTVEGDLSSALVKPGTVVLSESTARKYFGNEKAVGQTLSINDFDYEVTGVMKDTPFNTHHNFNMLLSFSTIEGFEFVQNWHSTMFPTYVKLSPGTDAADFAQKIQGIAYNYVADDLAQQKQGYKFNVQPVADIHLYSDYDFEAKPTGSAKTVYIFAVIGAMILVIAGLNFINLSTARSEIRAREVGLRKVMGAKKFSLIQQHLGEALLYSFLSLIIACILFLAVLPLYNQLVGITFSPAILLNPEIAFGLLLVTLIFALLAGFYPAVVLSSFSPLSMFKKAGKNNRGAVLRRIMVIGQFSAAVVLIIGTLTVFRQLNFMLDKELGFQKEQMLILPIRGGFDLETEYQPLKDELHRIPAVQGVTFSSSVPGRGVSNFAIRIDREENDMTQSMYHLFVDYDFDETYGLEIIAGRGLDEARSSDLYGTFLINEAAVKSFGWSSPEEAIGNSLQSGAGGFIAEIIGVFKDFNFKSVENSVEPLVLNITRNAFSVTTLRLGSEDMSGTVAQVRETWERVFPNKPFDYFFLDESYNAQYDSFERTGNILLTFSMLAILIACLGLYGLAAFSTQRRTREIGIRKVLGASVSSLTYTVTRDFILLVLIAVFFAIPVSWWATHTWLEQFAYHTNPDVGVFLLGGFIALAISILTVSWQSIRAAMANPVNSLRSE